MMRVGHNEFTMFRDTELTTTGSPIIVNEVLVSTVY